MRLHPVEADPIEEIGLTDTEFCARMGSGNVEDAVECPIGAALLVETTTRVHRPHR